MKDFVSAEKYCESLNDAGESGRLFNCIFDYYLKEQVSFNRDEFILILPLIEKSH
jgi:hypothetical protein